MSRTRSATFTSSIMTWAAAVQPGSPVPQTPATPHTSKSVYTPSSAHQFDLTALGYTSVFVHLPTTPATPPYLLNNNDNNTYPTPDLNLSENNNLSHLDRHNKPSCASPKDNKPSLDITDSSSSDASRHRIPLVGVLSRSRTRSKSMSAHSVPAKSSKASSKKHQQLPPSLMNELLLLQFTSGGKLDAHMTRAVEKGAVSDGKGGVWWDQDEYKPLVPRQPSPSKEKRRPAPLNLARQQPSFAPAVNSLPSAPLPHQKKSGMKSVRAFFSRDKAV